MSNTKHTPGPWGQNYICAASTNEVKAGGERIALVLQYDDKQNRVSDFETCNANAKLISAAPELLEALEELRTAIIDCVDSEWWGRHKETVAKAYEAIKKATE